MYRLHQNHKPHPKIGLVILAAVLMTAGMYGLSRVGWFQLNHAMQLVQAKAPVDSRHVLALEEGTGLVVPDLVSDEAIQTTPPAQTPPATVPVSENASATAVAATSCADQKQAAKSKYESSVKAEGSKYKAAKNKISDSYSAKGMAFSSSQKKAQKAESDRHNKVLKELEKNYQRELKQFDC